MLVFVPSPNALLLIYLTIVFFLGFFFDGAPHALVAKNNKQAITRAACDTFEGPTLFPLVYVPVGGSVLEA